MVAGIAKVPHSARPHTKMGKPMKLRPVLAGVLQYLFSLRRPADCAITQPSPSTHTRPHESCQEDSLTEHSFRA